MPIQAAFIVPHPPLIIPEIGKGGEKKIQKTVDSYCHIAEEIKGLAPDTIVFITPHSISYADYIHISPEFAAEGDFGRFGFPNISFGVMYERRLINDITEICKDRGISAGNLGGDSEEAKRLDHGFMIPLYFIQKYYQDFRCIRISISGLSFEEHYRLGQVVAEVCESYCRKTVIVASGDLSHKLKEDGPYGFSPDGPVFDKKICDIIHSGKLSEFMTFTEEQCNSAAECGLRTFIVMAGMLDNKTVESKLLSYEDTFGVGYSVGEIIVKGENKNDYVRLAKMTLEEYVNTRKIIDIPDDIDEALINNRAGVFVSLKKHGRLRGCIGTISPAQENIAKEIIANAISSGTKDYRFAPVAPSELADLQYSVDVLEAAEPISSMSELNTAEYGVIVTFGIRRGLLLPNLEGIDTPEQQVAIALDKAGISPAENYEMERFKVVRYK